MKYNAEILTKDLALGKLTNAERNRMYLLSDLYGTLKFILQQIEEIENRESPEMNDVMQFVHLRMKIIAITSKSLDGFEREISATSRTEATHSYRGNMPPGIGEPAYNIAMGQQRQGIFQRMNPFKRRY